VSERFEQLVAKHQRLRMRIALERLHLGETVQQIEHQLRGVDRGVTVARNLVSKPALIVGGVAFLALLGPRRVLRWLSRGAMFVATARRVMQLRF
jgi:ABC-type phosphate/phosphonate transport system ATPase subunit